jgi:hypothetical protein
VFWIKVSMCDGESLFLSKVGNYVRDVVVQCLCYHISQHICANIYAYTFYNWLLLQVIYIICALPYPEDNGTAFFELCGITCPVTQNHIPIKKYLEKLHDLKMFLQAIFFQDS